MREEKEGVHSPTRRPSPRTAVRRGSDFVRGVACRSTACAMAWHVTCSSARGGGCQREGAGSDEGEDSCPTHWADACCPQRRRGRRSGSSQWRKILAGGRRRSRPRRGDCGPAAGSAKRGRSRGRRMAGARRQAAAPAWRERPRAGPPATAAAGTSGLRRAQAHLWEAGRDCCPWPWRPDPRARGGGILRRGA